MATILSRVPPKNSPNVCKSELVGSRPSWVYKPGGEVPPGQHLPEGCQRISLGVEYDGSRFCGWQRQKHSPSVQQTLESALSRVANEQVRLVCAGRTDTGVHASGQVVHFDTYAHREPRNWLMGVNSSLAEGVAITWVKPTAADFHARFSAEARTYRYVICNTRYKPAILRNGLTWVSEPLDVALMTQALNSILGEWDFSSFRAPDVRQKARCDGCTPVP